MRNKLLTVAVILAFAGFLLWTTLSAQKTECEVCVEFNGGRNCAKASGDTEKQAAETAQTTACGPLVQGMDASIACGRRPPVGQRCVTK